jgi:hypothetical protein
MPELLGSARSGLHVRAWGHGPTPGWLHSWVPIIEAWAKNHWRYVDAAGTRDVPWWYRERPNLSVLAGAFWQTGGVALEEYRNEKWGAQHPGRADLWAATSDQYEYSIEAKHLWLGLNGSDPEQRLASAMEEAHEDAQKVDEAPHRRVALVICAPYATRPDREALRAFRAADYARVRAAAPAPHHLRVDLYPRWAPATGSDEWLPGVSLFLAFSRDE